MPIFQNLIAGSGFLQGPTGATGPAANTNITAYEYVATAGQTTFTGVDSKLQTLAYTPTGIFVTLNGSVLNDVVDFTATNGTDIVLTQAANADDELNIYAFPPFSVANTYTQLQTNNLLDTKLNLTGGTITGNVAISSNGFLQVPIGTTAQRPAATTQGYIRYNTTLNSLESANGTAWANVGSGAASSGGGVSWQPVQNTSFIAVTNSGYLVNTAIANVTVTLPANPTFGDQIQIVDLAKSFSSNNLILFPNGNRINANTSNTSLTYNGMSVGLVYSGATQGWVGFSGFTVTPVGNYTVEYLLVAGGGGGGGFGGGGGGGAGGFLTGAGSIVVPGAQYTVTVGAGGSGSASDGIRGSNGVNTSFNNLSAIAGGGGGTNTGQASGAAGGSGGGAGRDAASPGGSGTAGQGNAGGSTPGTSYASAAGGGGASGVGGNGSSSGPGPTDAAPGGNGGAGSSSSISGTTTTYAGGGGGSAFKISGGTGGSGGGGPGGNEAAGTPGTGNLGGGGGGGRNQNSPSVTYSGGNGGSGIAILRYIGNTQRGVGGNVTVSGGYVIHTFTSSGTFVA
jgi:hypothetical protein